ncbi:hypothetical protein [Pedobacter metabolipauper]|uniref:Uncharacterized protein n=1 Tax=Pedobacter metabolipauper TaxID=425513 RepID=A0A4R6SSC4_9SPHI|nr:hypothetical protein [Pedobacter metabolipauper]TDQ06243.1 hypothetical protein ATK78_4624 [Pedobacter metabolipauper]
MALLSQKSEMNYASAGHLQKLTYYCSVVHCSYYSSVQLMKHILLNKIGKTEAEIKSESSSTSGGSHVYMINETFNYLKLKNNKDLALFYNNINNLKKLRVEADYGEITIDHDKGKSSIHLSDEINKILKSTL